MENVGFHIVTQSHISEGFTVKVLPRKFTCEDSSPKVLPQSYGEVAAFMGITLSVARGLHAKPCARLTALLL